MFRLFPNVPSASGRAVGARVKAAVVLSASAHDPKPLAKPTAAFRPWAERRVRDADGAPPPEDAYLLDEDDRFRHWHETRSSRVVRKHFDEIEEMLRDDRRRR